MNKSFFLQFFNLLIKAGFLIFFVMLYWSSTLVEKDVKNMTRELQAMNREISALKGNIQIQKDPILSTKPSFIESESNLLKPDPFYSTTLPKLLGPNFKPAGMRREASIGKPKNLHVFSNLYHVVLWNSLCNVSLAGQEFGKYETMTPELALSLEEQSTGGEWTEYLIKLRQDVFWNPLNPTDFSENLLLAPHFLKKHRVTAHDVKFYFDAIMNPHVEEEGAVALRNFYSDIQEMRVLDDFTLSIKWRGKKIINEEGKETIHTKYLAKSITGGLRPLARFVYQYFSDGTKILPDDADPNTYRTNPIWAQNFSRHWANNVIVSCGPWIFDGLSEREIRFKRNPDFFEPYAALAEEYEVQFRDSPDAIWQEFKTGTLDLFTLPPNLLSELELFLQSYPYQLQAKEGLGINRLDYLARSYQYIGWNEANPLFNQARVRRALTIAIDRERIIRQNLNGMGVQTTGTFFPFSPSYDRTIQPYPFDPELAKKMLAEEGWTDSDGDGIIDKVIDGKRTPFSFTMTYYVKNPTTKAIGDYVSTAFKEIGIECKLSGVDIADLSGITEDKSFDAIIYGWALGTPPEDPKQLWYSAGATEKGSSNMIGFSNAEADKIIEALEYESDYDKRIALYHRFDAIIHEEAPYTFLYAPKTTLVYRDYLQNVFIPAERQDLIPGANVGEPQPSIFWINPPQ